MKNALSLWILGINSFLFGLLVSCENKSKEPVVYEREITIHIYHLDKNSEDDIKVKEESPVGSFLKNVYAYEKTALRAQDPSLMVAPSVTGPFIFFAKVSDPVEGESVVCFAATEDRSLSSHLRDVEKFNEFQSWFKELDLSFRKCEVSLLERMSPKQEHK